MIPESQSKWAWTRRTFLHTAMAGLTLAATRLPGTLAWADQLPQGRLTFVNVWSDERLAVTYRNEAGEYDLEALDDVNRIFRCHHTGEVAAIDVRMLEHINLVQKKFGGDREIHIISGFRSPVLRPGYRIGVPEAGWYREIFNSDADVYGGSNAGNAGGLATTDEPCHGLPHSVSLTLPPLAVVFFKRQSV